MFKSGDKVVCIEAAERAGAVILKDKTYTVKAYYPAVRCRTSDGVSLEEVRGADGSDVIWSYLQFKLAD